MAGDAKKRVLLLELAQHLRRRVGRSIVDYHDLVARRDVGPERERRLLHEQRQVLGFILGRNEHRHVDDRSCREPSTESRELFLEHGGHTRFRIRADSTPSWSRYLATVRRAICTPFCLRMLTI